MRLETLPITARSFEKDYHIDGDEFGRAYKDHISGFRTWTELDHADEWLIFPQNIGPHVSIDETCLSTGEVYTIVSNKDAHGRKGSIIAIVKGTKFCLEALQEVRREYRREQMTQDANAREEHRLMMKELAKNDGPWIDAEGNAIRRNARYCPERLENDETRAELLARSKGLLMMSPDKWTETQKERAEILFREFPDIKTAFSLTHSLRMVFSQRCSKDKGAESLHSWYTKVGEFGNKAFNDIAAAMYDRENEILNYFVNRSTNASAESLNAKIKQFRALLRGIVDKKFFLFRLTKIYA